jgi:hypothetical protein
MISQGNRVQNLTIAVTVDASMMSPALEQPLGYSSPHMAPVQKSPFRDRNL